MNFTKEKIAINGYAPHPFLSEFGLDNKPDGHFASVLKQYGLYEMPVVTTNKEIITHLPEILAAIQNGETHMDAYVISMTEIELKLFIFLKHKYHSKTQIASYKAACFFRKYLKSKLGMSLAKKMDGDINDKIGILMQTSGSTIKRLLRVGDNKPEYLGMIDEDNMSFHDATMALKVNDLTTKHKKRVENEKKTNSETLPHAIKNAPKEDIAYSILHGEKIVTFGHEKSRPFIQVGDKKLPKVVYEKFIIEESKEHGIIETHVYQQEIKRGACIHLKIENISKAA